MIESVASKIKSSIPREVPERNGRPRWMRYLPTVRAVKADVCLKLDKGNHWLGPWYAKVLAGLELRMKDSTKICLNLSGDKHGLIIDEYRSPIATVKGLAFDSWTEHAEPKSVIIKNGTPLLKTKYSKTWFYFWKKHEDIFMNPLKQFRKKIPYCYRISDRRRLNGEEFGFLQAIGKIDNADVETMPLLSEMVYTGKIPRRISYKELAEFVQTWAMTWSRTIRPSTLEEKITREMTNVFGRSVAGIEGTLQMLPDRLSLPGVLVKFKNTDPQELEYVLSKGWPYRPDDSFMLTSKFSTGAKGQLPYKFHLDSQIALDRLLIDGIADFYGAAGDIKADVSIYKDGVEATARFSGISAYLSPLGHGTRDPEVPSAFSTTGGFIYGGLTRDGIPSGLAIGLDKSGRLTATVNLAVRYELATPKGEFTIRGDVIASIDARALLGKAPQVRVGGVRIEIDNLRIFKRGETRPLISRARLIITDGPDEKKLMRAAHPNFFFHGTGFLVRLELEDLGGLDYKKGYLVGFLPMPVDSTDRYYEPEHFSLQKTLNLAFGLVTKDSGTEYKGELRVNRLFSIADGKENFRGEGIEVTGDMFRVTKKAKQHLLRSGRLRLVTRAAKDRFGSAGREVIALLNADVFRSVYGAVKLPHVSARFIFSNDSSVLGLTIDRLTAGFQSFRSPSLWADLALLNFKGRFKFDRIAHVLDASNLSGNFLFKHLAPRGISRASSGALSSFDADGYVTGNWRHDLRANRGRGLLLLHGDKEGDIHLRDASGRRVGNKKLGRETPLLSDTRWVVLGIDGTDGNGSLKGRFCLRTDIDLLALGAFGVTHADYIEWIMGHDHMPKSLNAFMDRAMEYYRDMKRGKKLPKGSADLKRDVCAKVFSRL